MTNLGQLLRRHNEWLLGEGAFEHLDGPILRVTGPEIPAIPFSPTLEKFFLINNDKMIAAMECLAAY